MMVHLVLRNIGGISKTTTKGLKLGCFDTLISLPKGYSISGREICHMGKRAIRMINLKLL